ncbi:nitrate ABC transporter permease [Sphingomonas sp. SRS2]|uniref:nitrate ABC transporter permease n=1 Tax=Sphingomonas sp. SRS2 TaxID=133190 RepID=UPI0006973EE1|nr:nitrate ABC transporter permease [Sphingomonas sp. SRS2]
MSSPVRLASSDPSPGKGDRPQAEIIPYPGTHPAASDMKKKAFDLSPVTARLQGAALAVLPTILMVAALLMVWEIACSSEDASLPTPSEVWTESHEVIVHPLKGVERDGFGFKIQDGGDVGIAGHILTSLARVGIGFSLSAIFGIALGILIGQSRFAYRALDPLFQILRTVPPLAWLPISLAIFQQAQPSAIFLIFITAIWPVILNTAAGVQNIPETYRNVGRVLSLNPFEYFIRIMLPATVPHMFTGLRIGVGMSWLAIVAAEMVQGGTGIGFFIWDSYNSSLLTDTIVALVWIGLIGFALDRIVGWIGRRVARQA